MDCRCDCHAGIHSMDNSYIHDNILDNVGVGSFDGSKVIDNVFLDSGITEPTNVLAYNNSIFNNYAYGSVGSVWGHDNGVAISNKIINNGGAGIYLGRNSDGWILKNNTIIGAQYGIRIDESRTYSNKFPKSERRETQPAPVWADILTPLIMIK